MTSDPDNIPADEWYKALALARRLDQWQHWRAVDAERERVFAEQKREAIKRARRKAARKASGNGNQDSALRL